jgi:hypothetical protein
MRVVLRISLLLLVAVSGAAAVPASEPIRPYLSEATQACAFRSIVIADSV